MGGYRVEAAEGAGSRERAASCKLAAAGSSALRVQAELALDERDQSCADCLGLVLLGCLDHHPDQRLGAGRAHEHPPAALERRALALDRFPERGSPPRPHRGRRPATFSSTCGSRSIGRASARSAPPSASSVSSAAAIPSPVGREIGPDHVARLLAAESPSSRLSSSAETLRSPTGVVATSIPAASIALWKP